MHALICGVTQSGKTTLAHSMAQMLANSGERIIVYDPVGTATARGTWPASAVLFSDEHEFFEYIARDDVNNAYIFIDEAGDIFTAQKRENLWLLTRGRHFGFSVFMIAQRPKMILPSARSMAGACYMFRLSADDQRDIGRDFGHNGLDKINLDRGDFIMLISGTSTFERGNVFSLA